MMAKPKILITGLVRDCAKTVLENIARIDSAFAAFEDRHWLVIESDSSDETLERLAEANASRANFDFISLGRLSKQIPERTARIAHCRNAYLRAVREDEKYSDLDFVAMADLDGINGRLTAEGVATCFKRSDWSACTANQDGPYYDLYALRHDIWCPDDWWRQHAFAQGLGVSENDSLKFACHSKMLTIPTDADWIEVDSAFGGLAIYRIDAISKTVCEYAGSVDGVGLCEHVPFNRCLISKGHRIFINPALINAGYTEHTRQLVGRLELERALSSLAKVARAQVGRLF